MEGENFESTNVESQSMETTGAYEESGSETYESSESVADDSGSDRDYSEGSEQVEPRSTTIARATSDEGTSFELFTDPVTGKTEFRVTSSDRTTEEEEGQTEEDSEPEIEPENNSENEGLTQQQEYNEAYNNIMNQPAKYTLDEFSYALVNNIVDESRVPDEYQAQYADFKISQAKAAYNMKVQEEQMQRERVMKQMQEESTPEARIAANENFFNNLEQEANRLAMQDLGITEKALEDADFSDDGGDALRSKLETAKNWHKQRIMNELQGRYQQEQAYRAQQQQIYKEIGEFTANAQKSEPHFQEIDKMLATAWQEMPTKYGTVVQNALTALAQGTITRQQAQVIQKYFEDTRRLYYARKNGLNQVSKPQVKKKPPVVESAGNGKRNISDRGPDYAALRNADARGKKAWLSDFFKDIEL